MSQKTPQKLVIQLSEEATAKYLAYASAITEAEVNADCEPSGCNIGIAIGPVHYGCNAYVVTGGEHIEFGAADVKLVDVKLVDVE